MGIISQLVRYVERRKREQRELMLITTLAARRLITDEKNWIERAHARRSDWSPCSPHDPHATKFCHDGAIRRIAWQMTGNFWQAYTLAEAIFRFQRGHLERSGMWVNDNVGHHGTLELLDMTAERLRS